MARGVADRLGSDAATTYIIAGAFLAGCEEVEDWGCGRGGFRSFRGGQVVAGRRSFTSKHK